MLYSMFPGRLPGCRDVLCDFRCGGYRVLGDILMDLEEQYRTAAIRKHKGVREEDTEQMRLMMHGAVDSPDYRQTLIQNCLNIISPTTGYGRGRSRERIDWDDAVKCAEALGKRSFLLEVMPSAALDLVIDCTEPEEDDVEGDDELAERMGRIFGLYDVSGL